MMFSYITRIVMIKMMTCVFFASVVAAETVPGRMVTAVDVDVMVNTVFGSEMTCELHSVMRRGMRFYLVQKERKIGSLTIGVWENATEAEKVYMDYHSVSMLPIQKEGTVPICGDKAVAVRGRIVFIRDNVTAALTVFEKALRELDDSFLLIEKAKSIDALLQQDKKGGVSRGTHVEIPKFDVIFRRSARSDRRLTAAVEFSPDSVHEGYWSLVDNMGVRNWRLKIASLKGDKRAKKIETIGSVDSDRLSYWSLCFGTKDCLVIVKPIENVRPAE